MDCIRCGLKNEMKCFRICRECRKQLAKQNDETLKKIREMQTNTHEVSTNTFDTDEDTEARPN